MQFNKRIFSIVVTLSLVFSFSIKADNDNLKIWYKKPAKEWVEALPLGNGRLGAMVYGGVENERIRLNEESLWSGRPIDFNPNPEAPMYLNKVREALLNGDIDLATQLCRNMQGLYTESYLPLADLNLTFDAPKGEVKDYKRCLDLATATQTTEYEVDGVKYRREAFISAPDQALFLKLTTDKKGMVNLSAAVSCQLHSEVAINGNEIILTGIAPVHAEPNYVDCENPIIYEKDGYKGMRFVMKMIIDAKGGIIEKTDTSLVVKNANEAIIRLTAATSFNGFNKDPYYDGKDEMAEVDRYMALSNGKKYDKIKKAHIADYQKYFNRVKIDLGKSVLTDDADILDRLIAYSAGASDPSLEALYYQFGRYLLISSSRPENAAAANLQGIWNHHLRAPWSSNFTTNINAQMNYWPAEMCNLSEMHQPFINQIKNMAYNGKHTAKNFYNANGWSLSHNSDIWAQTNPVGNLGDGDPMWANWYMGSPWVSQHLYEHYRFTGDKDFLADEAYPIMKGAAEFCLDWLIDNGDGVLVTAPSTSPENSYYGDDGKPHVISMGSTMDICFMHDIFNNVTEAAEILGIDEDFRNKIAEAQSKLPPLRIGKKGNLQEWMEDYEDVDPHHRHVSHLVGLHPGRLICPHSTPEYADACRTTLQLRGDDGTGWSLAWKINFWARLLDGDHAYKLLRNLLRVVGNVNNKKIKGGGSYANLFCAHPPFQIDGNFGGISGMTEMLLQSHENVIDILPALPAAWANGSIKGLRARNNFEVDMKWADGNLAKAKIISKGGNKCVIRTSVPITVKGAKATTHTENQYYITTFDTKKGKSYTISRHYSAKDRVTH